jgi:hypothetical protein
MTPSKQNGKERKVISLEYVENKEPISLQLLCSISSTSEGTSQSRTRSVNKYAK